MKDRSPGIHIKTCAELSIYKKYLTYRQVHNIKFKTSSIHTHKYWVMSNYFHIMDLPVGLYKVKWPMNVLFVDEYHRDYPTQEFYNVSIHSANHGEYWPPLGSF